MLLIEWREAQKSSFLKKRLEALFIRMKNRSTPGNSTNTVVLSGTGSKFGQFAITYDKARSEYHIANIHGNGCSFMLGKTYMSSYIDVKLYGNKCRYLLKNETDLPCFLYDLLEQFESLEDDYLKLIENIDMLEEAAGNIRKWIDGHFPNSGYGYHLLETENKILLSIPFRGRVQLSIPIYYRKYRKILPHVMDTVKAYEKIIKSSKIKVLITEI